MQLDLLTMNQTDFSLYPFIKSGPGINLLDFAKVTLKHFLSVPHGGCAFVGMGGHLQSSAWGMMTQSHGSGLDHVASFRMVLANGTVAVVSRNDTNATLYKAVLGSAPGSWGIITEYTLEGVKDLSVPFTRAIIVSFEYSKETFLAAFRQTQVLLTPTPTPTALCRTVLTPTPTAPVCSSSSSTKRKTTSVTSRSCW
jgi:FAD/FMN-containing dehydrogenase